jgi:hypothetical protein
MFMVQNFSQRYSQSHLQNTSQVGVFLKKDQTDQKYAG